MLKLNRKGQTLVEYVLIISLITVVAIAAVKILGGHLKDNCLVNVTAEIVLGEFEEYEFSREFDKTTGYKELVITNIK